MQFIPIGKMYHYYLGNNKNINLNEMNIIMNVNGFIKKISFDPDEDKDVTIMTIKKHNNNIYLRDIYYTENTEYKSDHDYVNRELFDTYILTLNSEGLLGLERVRRCEDVYNIAYLKMSYHKLYEFSNFMMNIIFHKPTISDIDYIAKITYKYVYGDKKIYYSRVSKYMDERRMTYDIFGKTNLRVKIPLVKMIVSDSTPTPISN
jgi:hypothetical protein